MNHLAGHTIIQTTYGTIFRGGPIVPHYPPHGAYVEGFLEVNEIDVHW